MQTKTKYEIREHLAEAQDHARKALSLLAIADSSRATARASEVVAQAIVRLFGAEHTFFQTERSEQ